MRFFLLWLVMFANTAIAETDGQLRALDDGGVQAFDPFRGEWVTPDEFWLGFIVRSTGRAWGRSKAYPPYDEVNELDTFLVELRSGTCHMQFFHSRWIRANDVQRWDSGFNDYSGCPRVFD